ncbi:RICIN domain-containing protein [Streptomyces sp. NPDC001276]|uniref:RICIN domain-containing protein n=1 Tax=Streptomyces sp. NPDC001276 TaxID=3364555 RepID=UPI0036CE17CC
MTLTERSDKNSTLRRSLHRAAGITAVLITTTFSLGVAGATTAQAATQDATWTLKNQETGRCLNGSWGNAHAFPCSGSPSQHWNVHQWKDGTRELKSMESGQCLDDSNDYGTRVYVCNATPYQSWYVHRWNDGTLELKNQATGRCLDDSFAYGLRTYPCNATPYQSWY